MDKCLRSLTPLLLPGRIETFWELLRITWKRNISGTLVDYAFLFHAPRVHVTWLWTHGRRHDAVGTFPPELSTYGGGDKQFGNGFPYENRPPERPVFRVPSRGHRIFRPGSEERQTGSRHIQSLCLSIPGQSSQQWRKPFEPKFFGTVNPLRISSPLHYGTQSTAPSRLVNIRTFTEASFGGIKFTVAPLTFRIVLIGLLK